MMMGCDRILTPISEASGKRTTRSLHLERNTRPRWSGVTCSNDNRSDNRPKPCAAMLDLSALTTPALNFRRPSLIRRQRV